MASTIGTALDGKTAVISGDSSSAYKQASYTFEEIEGTYTLKQVLDYVLDTLADFETRIAALEGA